jgi:hypothetical protein
MATMGLSAAPALGAVSFTPAGSHTFGAPELWDVVVADFNNDARPDAATANGDSANVSLLLGDGSGGFGPAATFPGGAHPTALAVADFNTDGNRDLATANAISDRVAVLLGDGSGGFGPAAIFPAGSSPLALAVGDFNTDGRPDLVTVSHISDRGSVLLGIGSGAFGPPASFVAGTNPQSVAVADFNADGRSDVVVGNDAGLNSPVTVLLGDGSGGFAGGSAFLAGTVPIAVAVGNFNADGRADVVTANIGDDAVGLLLGNGSGGLGPPAEFPVGVQPNSLVVADFTVDGRLDVATANGGGPAEVSVLEGDGLGGFAPAAGFLIAPGVVSEPKALAVGDLNTDGLPDLVTANHNPVPSTISVLLNTTAVAPVFGVSPTSVNFGDVVVGRQSASATLTVRNTGTGILQIAHSLVGSHPTDFAVTGGTCTSQVAPASRCTLTVRFAPRAAGARRARLRFVSNAAGSPHEVALAGRGCRAIVIGLLGLPVCL